MSDQKPVEGTQIVEPKIDAPVAPAAPKPPITKEAVRQAYKNRDAEKIKQMSADIDAANAPASQTSAQPVQASAATQPPEPAKKTFNVRYAGREINHPDDDSYLNEGGFPNLKRRAIILKETLRDKETEIEEARKYGSQTAAEKEQTLKELDLIKKQLAEAQTQIKSQSAAIPAPAQAPAAAQQRVDTALDLTPPEKPVYSGSDRTLWSEDDWKKNALYEEESSKYMAKLADAIRMGQSAGIKQEEIAALASKIADEKVQAISAQMSDKFKRIESWEADQKKQIAERQQKLAENKLYSEIDAFQKKHEEFKTAKDVREIAPGVFTWIQAIADKNGVKLPYGYTKEQFDKFWVDASGIARKFIDEDPDVLKKSEGIDPPDGTREYIDLFTVLDYRNKIAPNQTLDEAYAAYSEKMGWNQRAHDDAQREGLLRGVRSAQRSLSTVQQDYATNLPNRMAGQAAAPTSAQDDAAILAEAAKGSRAYATIQGDPEKKKRFDAAMSRLNQAQQPVLTS